MMATVKNRCKQIPYPHRYAGVKVGGNAVPAISAIWRSQASKSAFPSELTFPGRKDSFIHGNATSECEFGQDTA